MALILETGAGVTGAQSYASAADVRAYAASRARTVPAEGAPGDASIEAALVAACDHLEGYRDRFTGTKVDAAQALQWPRENATLDGFTVEIDALPAPLKSAQIEFALAILDGVNLSPVGDGREVIRKKIDVLETEYAPGSGGAPQPIVLRAESLLAPLLRSGGGVTFLRA